MLSGWLKVTQPVSDGARVKTGVSDFKAHIPFLLPRECLAPSVLHSATYQQGLSDPSQPRSAPHFPPPDVRFTEAESLPALSPHQAWRLRAVRERFDFLPFLFPSLSSNEGQTPAE